ncbi:MAG: hypothetical protein ACREJU_18805 [Nitrospiraceae bacterium]
MNRARSEAVYVLIGVLFIGGCSTSATPKSTQTGKIYDIKIGDSINPKLLEVRPGDEVRWVNGRGSPIKIVFIDDLKDRISCENGFVNGMFSWAARNLNVTTVKANHYASLCFLSPGRYRYTARMEAPVPGGEKNESGSVLVD